MAVRDKKKQTETGFITAGDRYLFGEGTHYEICLLYTSPSPRD